VVEPVRVEKYPSTSLRMREETLTLLKSDLLEGAAESALDIPDRKTPQAFIGLRGLCLSPFRSLIFSA